MTEQELQQFIEKLQALEKRLLLFEAHDHFISGGAPIQLKNLPFYGYHHANVTLKDTEGGANAKYDSFFVADFDLEVIAAEVSFRTAAGAVATLDIYKLTTGQARASGITVLSSTIDLNGTAQTPVRRTPTTIRFNRILKQGDRLALVDSGTVSSVNHLVVSVYFLPL